MEYATYRLRLEPTSITGADKRADAHRLIRALADLLPEPGALRRLRAAMAC